MAGSSSAIRMAGPVPGALSRSSKLWLVALAPMVVVLTGNNRNSKFDLIANGRNGAQNLCKPARWGTKSLRFVCKWICRKGPKHTIGCGFERHDYYR